MLCKNKKIIFWYRKVKTIGCNNCYSPQTKLEHFCSKKLPTLLFLKRNVNVESINLINVSKNRFAYQNSSTLF